MFGNTFKRILFTLAAVSTMGAEVASAQGPNWGAKTHPENKADTMAPSTDINSSTRPLCQPLNNDRLEEYLIPLEYQTPGKCEQLFQQPIISRIIAARTVPDRNGHYEYREMSGNLLFVKNTHGELIIAGILNDNGTVTRLARSEDNHDIADNIWSYVMPVYQVPSGAYLLPESYSAGMVPPNDKLMLDSIERRSIAVIADNGEFIIRQNVLTVSNVYGAPVGYIDSLNDMSEVITFSSLLGGRSVHVSTLGAQLFGSNATEG